MVAAYALSFSFYTASVTWKQNGSDCFLIGSLAGELHQSLGLSAKSCSFSEAFVLTELRRVLCLAVNSVCGRSCWASNEFLCDALRLALFLLFRTPLVCTNFKS
jgi:hypothetical protein